MPDIQYGQLSITGNYRKNNEDNLYIDQNARFFLVADGMGGQSAGEKASQMAIELISQKLEELVDFSNSAEDAISEAINSAVGHANAEIMTLGRADPEFHNMGTTIVSLLAAGNEFYIGNVGDSRCYLLRDGHFSQLTKDHSLVQALIEAGTISPEEARTHRYRNVLYRYLGSKEGGEGVTLMQSTPQPGDRYLLCTDGVTDGLEDEDLQQLLSVDQDPQQMAEAIVLAAQQGGSRDNITCVVLQVN